MSKRVHENIIIKSLTDVSPSKQPCLGGILTRESEKILRDLCTLFPEEKFNKRVPKVVMKHMVYNQIKNRTKADKEMDEMQKEGKIRMFKLGGEQDSLAILFTEDFVQLMNRRCSNPQMSEKFVRTILEKNHDISIDKTTLCHLGFSESDIKCLVQESLLTVRSATSYWFSFPGAGEFMKSYLRGRQAIMATIRKSKYQQILLNELESRNMKNTVPLGIRYHVHDIVGADLVVCNDTTSGILLNLSSSMLLFGNQKVNLC